MKRTGLTVLEVLISLMVVGVVMVLLSSTFVGNMKVNKTFGQRTQAVQLLALVGRLANGALTVESPEEEGDVVTWDYGTLASKLEQLKVAEGEEEAGDFADSDLYRVEIENGGNITFIGSTLTQFNISVCWKDGGAESCARGATVGPLAQTSTTPPNNP